MIKNYTTTLSAQQHLAKLQSSLIDHGAVGIQLMFDSDKRISALSFGLNTKNGIQAYSLPCEWRKFQQVLKNQEIKRCDEDEYCYRVAWACIKDWVLAQMALYETNIVEMPQVFLPFAQTPHGKTIFELVEEKNLLLVGGNKE